MCLKKKKNLKEHFFSSCEKYFRGTFWRRLLICPVKCAKFPCLVILLEAQRLRVCWGGIFFPFFFFLIRSDTFHCDCLTEASGINIFFFVFESSAGNFYKTKEILCMRNYAVTYVMHYILPSPHFIHMWILAQLC